MARLHSLPRIITLISLLTGIGSSQALAADVSPNIQDRYSSPSKGRVLLPSEKPRTPKQPPTIEQRLDYLTSKIATLEQTVTTLQSQVIVQTQQIAQLRQVISVHSSGAVTIQAPNILNISAGSTVKLEASLVDVKAGLTGVHGVLKADTVITTNVISPSYSPGAGNIW
ncbi:MAG: hypothetical protein KC563_07855 [Nitrospira sp.]|nr:hypothetical protein [Nitrospira sp.]MCB9710903.1 hypothetical protein [Nitrospiraceae bacterium]MDR4486541.1 SlyX family protein [Nitrospirales bacterium]MCA9475706.1 hypothetical protein [Nitrospira sp.]MCA9478775.1 hypothetical protein [Nitrospira sp.]